MDYLDGVTALHLQLVCTIRRVTFLESPTYPDARVRSRLIWWFRDVPYRDMVGRFVAEMRALPKLLDERTCRAILEGRGTWWPWIVVTHIALMEHANFRLFFVPLSVLTYRRQPRNVERVLFREADVATEHRMHRVIIERSFYRVQMTTGFGAHIRELYWSTDKFGFHVIPLSLLPKLEVLVLGGGTWTLRGFASATKLRHLEVTDPLAGLSIRDPPDAAMPLLTTIVLSMTDEGLWSSWLRQYQLPYIRRWRLVWKETPDLPNLEHAHIAASMVSKISKLSDKTQIIQLETKRCLTRLETLHPPSRWPASLREVRTDRPLPDPLRASLPAHITISHDV